MNVNDRVEITDGVLAGEKATILNEKNTWAGFVLLHFNNHEKEYGKEKDYAILSEQWFEIERLRTVK